MKKNKQTHKEFVAGNRNYAFDLSNFKAKQSKYKKTEDVFTKEILEDLKDALELQIPSIVSQKLEIFRSIINDFLENYVGCLAADLGREYDINIEGLASDYSVVIPKLQELIEANREQEIKETDDLDVEEYTREQRMTQLLRSALCVVAKAYELDWFLQDAGIE